MINIRWLNYLLWIKLEWQIDLRKAELMFVNLSLIGSAEAAVASVDADYDEMAIANLS